MVKKVITICGCGNGAHACAAMMCQKGHSVNIYSPLREEIEVFRQGYSRNNGLRLRFGPGALADPDSLTPEELQAIEVTDGLQIDKISSDPAEVIPQADVVFIIVPAFAHQNILLHIRPYLSQNSLLVVLACRSGLEFQLRFLMPDAKVLGFQTLPWSARLTKGKMGEEVSISARKNSIQAASTSSDLPDEYFSMMEDLLDMRVERIKHLLTLSLANVGQIVHPGIMYSLFKDDPYQEFEEKNAPLFYQGVDEEGAQRLASLSDEIIQIAQRVAERHPVVQADKVQHLSAWLLSSYGSQMADTSSLYKMITTNQAYDGLKAPYVKNPETGKCHVNLKARYLTEDVPYGLLVTKSIGMMFEGLETPTIDEVLSGVSKWTGRDYLKEVEVFKASANQIRVPYLYGCTGIEDLI